MRLYAQSKIDASDLYYEPSGIFVSKSYIAKLITITETEEYKSSIKAVFFI